MSPPYGASWAALSKLCSTRSDIRRDIMGRYITCLTAGALLVLVVSGYIKGADDKKEDHLAGWTHDFSAEKADLTHTGRNPYFILEPGYFLVLEKKDEQITLTVLDETKTVDGV